LAEAEAKEIGATAGIVADTYVDGVLEALEREIDLIPERQEVFEGRELSRDEQDLFRGFAEQVRFELDRRAVSVGFRVPRVDPEHMGRGFRFYWTKRGGEQQGHVDYHYDDVIRFMRDGETPEKFGEAIGRRMIDGILKALVESVPS
jgi:hypothetical protein